LSAVQPLRSLFALGLGFCVAGAVIEFIESLGEAVFPLSAPQSIRNAELLGQQLQQVPPEHLLPVLLAWIVGPFVGALVAAYVAGYAPMAHGLLLGAVIFTLVLALLVTVSYPLWFGVLGLGSIFPSSYISIRLFGPRKESDKNDG
jgi:hypothetical protein